jgi:hypothetical protein
VAVNEEGTEAAAATGVAGGAQGDAHPRRVRGRPSLRLPDPGQPLREHLVPGADGRSAMTGEVSVCRCAFPFDHQALPVSTGS